MTALPGRMVLVCARHSLLRLRRGGAPTPTCPACSRDGARRKRSIGKKGPTPWMRRARRKTADEKFLDAVSGERETRVVRRDVVAVAEVVSNAPKGREV